MIALNRRRHVWKREKPHFGVSVSSTIRPLLERFFIHQRCTLTAKATYIILLIESVRVSIKDKESTVQTREQERE